MSNYTSAYVIQSANLAMKIQDEYKNKAGRYDKGVHRQSIWVLWRTAMPSILTEIGFLTNPTEEKFLASDEGQTYIAKAIFRAFRKYRDETDGVKKEYKDAIELEPPIENENFKAGNMPGQVPKDLEEDTANGNGDEEESEDDKKNDAKEEKQEKDSSVVEKKETPAASEEVVYRVQFASSQYELPLGEKKYNMIKSAWYYENGNMLKYTSGKFFKMSEAVEHQEMLRKNGFSDCFVVAFQGEKRISVVEAKKLTGQ